MNIGVIGAGKFGLVIANQLSLNKQNLVVVLSRCSNKIDSIVVIKRLSSIMRICLKT